MNKAIEIQEEITEEAENVPLEQQIKDKFILACRYYTGGAILHNYIMSLDWHAINSNQACVDLNEISNAIFDALFYFSFSIEVLVGGSRDDHLPQ